MNLKQFIFILLIINYAFSLAACGTLATGVNTLTVDLTTTTTCITAVANSALDCNGHIIKGNLGTSIGVDMGSALNNVTVKNCNLYNLSTAIKGTRPSNSLIINNNITNYTSNGAIYITTATGSNTNITNNYITQTVAGNVHAIQVLNQQNILINGNTINKSNLDGIRMDTDTGAIVANNTFVNIGEYGIWLSGTGSTMNQFQNNNFTNITRTGLYIGDLCCGTPPAFSANITGGIVLNATTGYKFDNGASNIIITGVTVIGSGAGINVSNAKLITVQNSLIINTTNSGIWLSSAANNNTINNLSIQEGGTNAIWITDSGSGNNNFNNTNVYSSSGTFINQTATELTNAFYQTLLGYNTSYGWSNWTNFNLTVAREIRQIKNVQIRTDFVSVNDTALPELNGSAMITLLTDTPCIGVSVYNLTGFPFSAAAITAQGTFLETASCTSGVANFSVSHFSGFALNPASSLTLNFSGATNVAVLYYQQAGSNYTNITNLVLYLDNYPLGQVNIIFNGYQRYQFINNRTGVLQETIQLISRNATSNVRAIDSGIGVVTGALVKAYTLVNGTWIKYHQEFTNTEGFVYLAVLGAGNPIKVLIDKDGYTEAIALEDTANMANAEYDIRMSSGNFNFVDGFMVVPQYSGNTYADSTQNFSFYMSSINPRGISVYLYENGTLQGITNIPTADNFLYTITNVNQSDNFTIQVYSSTGTLLYTDGRTKAVTTIITPVLQLYMDQTWFLLAFIFVIILCAVGEFFYLKGFEIFMILCVLCSLINIFFVPLMICAIIYWRSRGSKVMYSESG